MVPDTVVQINSTPCQKQELHAPPNTANTSSAAPQYHTSLCTNPAPQTQPCVREILLLCNSRNKYGSVAGSHSRHHQLCCISHTDTDRHPVCPGQSREMASSQLRIHSPSPPRLSTMHVCAQPQCRHQAWSTRVANQRKSSSATAPLQLPTRCGPPCTRLHGHCSD
jgi:hypothetical protein